MLGLKARDMVTGFEGTIIGRTEWLTGCATVGLAPHVDKDGKVPETEWFDETRVALLEDEPAFIPLPAMPRRGHRVRTADEQLDTAAGHADDDGRA